MWGAGWADEDVKVTVILSDDVSFGGVNGGGSFVCLAHVCGRAWRPCFAMTPRCQTPQAPGG